jgi:hypothetical protein
MTVIVQIVTFWLCHNVVLQLDISISEEDVTSTLKVKVCRVKNQLACCLEGGHLDSWRE